MERYLRETPMLDFSAPSIRALISERGWDEPGRGYTCAADDGRFEKIRSIYDFVRDEILFGYNADDSIPASKVLRDGYGQCIHKDTLFMAALRACRIPVPHTRIHDRQKAAERCDDGIRLQISTAGDFHSWVEVLLEGTWL